MQSFIQIVTKRKFGLFSIYLLNPDTENLYIYHWLNINDYFIKNIATNLVCFLGYGFVNFYISVSQIKIIIIGFGMAYFLLLIGILYTEYKKYFIFLMLPNLLFIYVMPFHLWHSGILVLITLLILWINHDIKMPILQKLMVAIFIIAQITASSYSIYKDITESYSGAKELYNYLQKVNIKVDNDDLYFFNGVSVCPYLQNKNCTYWDWRKQGFHKKLKDNAQIFIINKESYKIYEEHFHHIMNGDYKRIIFKSNATFGLEDISDMETLYLYYKEDVKK